MLLLNILLGCIQEPVTAEGTIVVLDQIKSEQKIIRFGIVPQQAAVDIETNWGPLASYIETHSDFEIKIKTASSIPEFEKRVLAGEYDIAYMNPYHYVLFSEQAGYRAFAKQKGKSIQGVLVVKKESNYTKISDFKGQEAAFPSPLAFAASLLTRSEFSKKNISITPKYLRSHDSVYASVAQGLYPVGGGVKRTLASTDPEIREQLRVLWTTESYTPHAFAAHPDISNETIENILSILKSINTYPEKEPILSPIRFKGFERANHHDWDDIRKLNLKDL
jgi:phosphonate transport system substrate-binding protein